MTRMRLLSEPVGIEIAKGWNIVAKSAGVTSEGTRVDIELHNGTVRDSDVVPLSSRKARQETAKQFAEYSGADPSHIVNCLLQLKEQVDGLLSVEPDELTGAEEEMKAHKVTLSDVEPWDDPVDGASLIRTIQGVIERFLVLPEGASYTTSLWILHTYCIDAATISPILHISSPQPRCGKSTLMLILFALCRRALLASNITQAAVYRAIEKWRPSLLVDEVDTFLKHNEELRGILNSGHTRWTANVVRCDVNTNEPELFLTWGPKALSGIGSISDTLRDRSIPIEMRRRLKDETVEKFRLDRMWQFEDLKRQCLRWAIDHESAIQSADPSLPEFLDDRAADNWRTLCAIAEVAGEDYLERVHAAIRLLNKEGGEEEESASVMLLRDLKNAFDTCSSGRMPSSNFLCILHEMEDRPWTEWGRQRKPISMPQVARLLKLFGIRPKILRDNGDVLRGYMIEDCQDAFSRYLSPAHLSQTVTPLQSSNHTEINDFQTVTTPLVVTDKKTREPTPLVGCNGVTIWNGEAEGKNIPDDIEEGVI